MDLECFVSHPIFRIVGEWWPASPVPGTSRFTTHLATAAGTDRGGDDPRAENEYRGIVDKWAN